jgi:hypothetical protein
VVERSFLEAAGPADLSWAVREPSGELTPSMLNALHAPDVAFDRPCPAVKYAHRRLKDADLYFFFNESEQSQSREATLAGSGRAQAWDAASGAIRPLSEARAGKGVVRLPLVFEPYEARFVVIGTLPGGVASSRGKVR